MSMPQDDFMLRLPQEIRSWMSGAVVQKDGGVRIAFDKEPREASVEFTKDGRLKLALEYAVFSGDAQAHLTLCGAALLLTKYLRDEEISILSLSCPWGEYLGT